MALNTLTNWTKEAVGEFQAKMKAWVLAMLPTKVSELSNDKGFITSSDVKVMTGATSTTDGASGTVPAPTKAEKDKVLSGTGSWVSLPTKTSELTNNSGFISAPTLTTVDTSSWEATATLTLDSTHFNVINVPSTTTSLTIETPSSTSIEAYSLQLTVSSDTTTVNFTYGGNPCKLAGAPDSWDPAATYQITIVNGCAAIGAFE